jgi:phosphomannomutase
MDYVQRYADFLNTLVPLEKPVTIVSDASNGPAGMVIKKIFDSSPHKVIQMNDTIDPDFSAHGPNPLSPKAWEEAGDMVKKHNAALGVIFDADADRAVFIDDNGRHVPGYYIALLLMKESEPPFVADELLYNVFRSCHVPDIYPSNVGSLFVKKTMREHNASFGGENSGHFYFRDFFFCDSGIVTLLKVLQKLEQFETTFSEFIATQPLHIVQDTQVSFSKSWPDIMSIIAEKYEHAAKPEIRDGITYFHHNEWVNVRPSNTEPILRITVGSVSSDRNKEMTDNMIKFLQKNGLISEIKSL